MNQQYIHTEWWDHRLGKEVLMEILKLISGYTKEGVQVLNTWALDMTGDYNGECDLHFVVIPRMPDMSEDIIYCMRMNGYRVKLALNFDDSKQLSLPEILKRFDSQFRR